MTEFAGLNAIVTGGHAEYCRQTLVPVSKT